MKPRFAPEPVSCSFPPFPSAFTGTQFLSVFLFMQKNRKDVNEGNMPKQDDSLTAPVTGYPKTALSSFRLTEKLKIAL